MKFENLSKNLEEKIGKENVAKISNEIAEIMSYESEMTNSIKEKDEAITRLNSDKEMLIQANGNLLQKLPKEKEEVKIKEEEEIKKPFDYRSIFDENGKLKGRL